jgi:hypothetical protein
VKGVANAVGAVVLVVGRAVATEAREWLKWTVGGAVTGAVGAGGAGLFYFGMKGLAWGVVGGAVVGGVAGLVLILMANSESIFG